MLKKSIKITLAIVTAFIVVGGSSGLIYYLVIKDRTPDTNPNGETDLIFNTLVWSDEFDYEGLPTASKWNFEIQGPGWVNNELQNYVKRWENSRVANGTLTLEARLDNFDGEKYSSARITTQYKGDWKYGRFEARAILPGGTGIWPAIWMFPTHSVHGNWPQSGELDIMEYVGYDPTVVHGSVHSNSYNHLLGTQKTGSSIVPTCETAYHVYAMEWYPTNISFFVDDTNYFTFYKDNDATWEEWPFDEDFFLILNVAVGGFWGGSHGVNDAIFPQQMVIDYVRVYQ